MVIRMLKEFSENFSGIKKDMETIRKEPVKDTLTEITNNLQGISGRGDEAKNQISDLEYKEAKNTHQNSKKKKNFF